MKYDVFFIVENVRKALITKEVDKKNHNFNYSGAVFFVQTMGLPLF